jgi:hypothetical protein
MERDIADRALLACLRWDAEGEQRLRELTEEQWQGLWRIIAEGAGYHLLSRRLARTSVRPPENIVTALRVQMRSAAVRYLTTQAAITEAASNTGRPLILLKGFDLASRIYANVGQRPMGDADLLVRPEDLSAYVGWFGKKGFSIKGAVDDAITKNPNFHHVMLNPPNRMTLPIELHWRLSCHGDYANVDIDGLWERAVQVPGSGPGISALSPEDLFLHLCLHLRHHDFETPLTQVWDLAEVVLSPSLKIDWSIVWNRAESWNLVDTVRISSAFVSRVLGVSAGCWNDRFPDLDLAFLALLPDPFDCLGRHPKWPAYVSPRLIQLLSSRSSFRDRMGALYSAVFLPREDARTLFGRPDDGPFCDGRAHLRHWAGFLQKCGWLIRQAIAPGGALTTYINRKAALRSYLDNR